MAKSKDMYIEQCEVKVPEILMSLNIPYDLFQKLGKLDQKASEHGVVFKSTEAMVDQLDRDVSKIEKHLGV